MLRSRTASAALLFASCSVIVSTVCEASPKRIKLPMLEVPDDLGNQNEKLPPIDRSSLLRKPIELSHADDRRLRAREQVFWSQLSSSLCTGCGETRRVQKVHYVDPIAVLNAKPSSLVAASAPTHAIKPKHVARVRIAHRRRHRSILYSYYSRLRFSVLRWHRHHRIRARAVNRGWTSGA